MLKLIIVGVAGYIVYRTVKTKVKTMIFGPQDTKEIKSTADLVPCANCGSHTDRNSAITRKKKDFCCPECLKTYIEKEG